MGHVMRCLAVADALAARGMTPLFVTRAAEDGAGDVLRAAGVAVEELPVDVAGEDDARLMWKLAERHGARLIVTDLCDWEALRWPEALRAYHAILDADHVVLAFTGGRLVDLPARVVVAPYVHVATPPAEAGRTVLCGPAYFVFRREFVAAAGQSRAIAPRGRRVLVTLGGADPARLTAKTLRALGCLTDLDVEVRVIVGPRFPAETRAEIGAGAAALGSACTLLRHDTDLAAAMLWADLAITADGFTRYETAVTGTPSLTLELPASDAAINAIFAAAGTTGAVPDAVGIGVPALARLVRELLGDHARRREMSRRGRALVDGRGIERILDALPPGVLA
jgi:spore coat polysaccharide biosynthesis predicted glycosyltransferase SpsG